VTVTTLEATMGIRGGTATISQGPNGTRSSTSTVISRSQTAAARSSVDRPGYMVTITGCNRPPGQPTKVTDAIILHCIEYLSSKFWQNAGVGNLTSVEACSTAVTPPCPQPPWLPPGAGPDGATNIIMQSTQRATGTTPPPPPPTFLFNGSANSNPGG